MGLRIPHPGIWLLKFSSFLGLRSSSYNLREDGKVGLGTAITRMQQLRSRQGLSFTLLQASSEAMGRARTPQSPEGCGMVRGVAL